MSAATPEQVAVMAAQVAVIQCKLKERTMGCAKPVSVVIDSPVWYERSDHALQALDLGTDTSEMESGT